MVTGKVKIFYVVIRHDLSVLDVNFSLINDIFDFC